MSSYQYKSNCYYIIDKHKPPFTENGEYIGNEMTWILQCQHKKFSLRDDPNLSKGTSYISFIHELCHYYQDLSITSCIAQHIYKSRYLKKWYDSHFDLFATSSILNLDEDVYHIIYETPRSIKRDNILRFSEGIGEIIITDHSDHFFPCFSYRDMIECYAEMKAWQSIICETPDSEDNHDYILSLLRGRNGSLFYDEDASYVNFKYENEHDRYTILRSVFLSFFHHCTPNGIYLFNHVPGLDNVKVIDFILHMGLKCGKKINGKYSYYPINSTEYLLKYELNLLHLLLFVMDVALTIPSTDYIVESINKGLYTIEDFHPCSRFFKVLSFIYTYPSYISYLEENSRWVTAYDDISSMFGWPLYTEIENSFQTNLPLCNDRLLASYKKMFLKFHRDSTMGTNNGAIFRMFRELNIIIPIQYNNGFFMMIRYPTYESSVQSLQIVLISKLHCFKCFFDDAVLNDVIPNDYKTVLEGVLAIELVTNDVNMKLYNNITTEKFDCMFHPYCNRQKICCFKTMNSLIDVESKGCASQEYICYVLPKLYTNSFND